MLKPDLPDQRPSLLETLAAYTRSSAWVEFMEDRKGMLKPGYLADVVVLSGDIEAVPFIQLATLLPMMTVCDGRSTYET
ncbi:amidohydrolase family protein [Sinorhizobium alkalisoli]|uniref:amidohydrolase family protein n=1 Tax=Sinorhizobium alkalisoli TaxID=1752398 RepID=UPI0012A95234|nr:amidohydrolase family protein [Sinorhizobium alkalisoli]QFI66274.1 Exoenzymes regulatory protein AepA precursor [Sinorhizobium alkalisoli]